MSKKKRTVEVRGLGKMSRRAAILMVVLLIFGILGAVATTNLAVNYGILRARVLFLEKVTQTGYQPEDVDELYERALKLQPPMDLSPKLSEILSICERIEKHLDRPVVVSNDQLQNLKGGFVYLVGVVTKVTKKDPHLFLTVNDVFVPAFNLGKDLAHIKIGYKVAIAGQVKEYQGQLEVIPSTIDDVMVLETE
jgi:hypothetical protein